MRKGRKKKAKGDGRVRPSSRPSSPCLPLRTGGSRGLTAFFLKAKERRACEVVGEENEWVAETEAEKKKRGRRATKDGWR